jgi:hypothetical protein
MGLARCQPRAPCAAPQTAFCTSGVRALHFATSARSLEAVHGDASDRSMFSSAQHPCVTCHAMLQFADVQHHALAACSKHTR